MVAIASAVLRRKCALADWKVKVSGSSFPRYGAMIPICIVDSLSATGSATKLKPPSLGPST